MRIPEYPDDRLRAMTAAQRHQLHKNAMRHDLPEARALAERIRALGLPYSEPGGTALDDPLVIRIARIIESPEAARAMKSAVAQGQPPLAGADPLIAAALGADYGSHNQTTNNAGYLVSQKMKSMGYRQTGESKPLPRGCVARSGMVFRS